MMVLTNQTVQTIAPGQSVTFDRVRQSGNCECWSSQLPNSVKLRANGATYLLSFTGNVASTTAGDVLQLAISIAGQPLVETTMTSTPTAINEFNNISALTLFSGCCCDCDRVTVTNTGTTTITLAANPALVVARMS